MAEAPRGGRGPRSARARVMSRDPHLENHHTSPRDREPGSAARGGGLNPVRPRAARREGRRPRAHPPGWPGPPPPPTGARGPTGAGSRRSPWAAPSRGSGGRLGKGSPPLLALQAPGRSRGPAAGRAVTCPGCRSQGPVPRRHTSDSEEMRALLFPDRGKKLPLGRILPGSLAAIPGSPGSLRAGRSRARTPGLAVREGRAAEARPREQKLEGSQAGPTRSPVSETARGTRAVQARNKEASASRRAPAADTPRGAGLPQAVTPRTGQTPCAPSLRPPTPTADTAAARSVLGTGPRASAERQAREPPDFQDRGELSYVAPLLGTLASRVPPVLGAPRLCSGRA
ncbi:collagen alpha-1(I) chain-like [Perognathus longimembris pacificus]|uniref:collagen alpha-1(I) chain-like n=1 Tax=Perognathus longimembris pacificus TaxID=214514 RepID=UPI002019FBB4|nr:collagen alpha-1(I) chain-like [Perognathus longimembris pacificus]